MSFFITLRKEIMEQSRTKRLLITCVVFTAFGLLSPLMARYMAEIFRFVPGGEQFTALIPPPTVTDAIAQYIKNISQFGVLLALLLGMGSVAQEKERGTAAMMLSKPISRASFLLAKFAGLAFTFLAGTALAAAAGYMYTLLLFEPLEINGWLALNGMIWIYTLVYAAITLFFSTLMRSQAAAGGMGFGVLVLLGLIGSVPSIAKVLPAELLNWGALISLGAAEPRWTALIISLAIITAAVIGAWLVLRKQEL